MQKTKRNKTGLLLALIAIAFFIGSASALTVSTSPASIEKGAQLKITGSAATGIVQLKISSGEWLVKELAAETGPEGNYSIDYNIPFSAPQGDWAISAKQGNEEATTDFEVKNSSESAFLLITIISPTEKNFVSTEKARFEFKVTDSGKNVERANVFLWFPNAEKKLLEEKSPGVYSGEITIPPETQPSEYTVFATAEKVYSMEKIYGGENNLNLEIARPEINIKVLRPVLPEALFGKPLEIAISPEYSTGIVPQDIEVTASAEGEKIDLQKNGSEFTASYTPKGNSETIKISVFAYDSYGNSGKKDIELKITGREQNFLEKNSAYIALAAIIITALIIFGVFSIRKKGKQKSSAHRKKEISLQMKDLEERFYKKSTIDRKTFQEEMSKYKNELEDLERKK